MHTYAYAYSYACGYAVACICTCMCICMRMLADAHAYACANICMQSYMHTHMHACMHIHASIHPYTAILFCSIIEPRAVESNLYISYFIYADICVFKSTRSKSNQNDPAGNLLAMVASCVVGLYQCLSNHSHHHS